MKNFFIAISIILLFTQCQIEEQAESKSTDLNQTIPVDTINEEALIVNNIELFKITQDVFPDAILEMNTPTENQNFTPASNISFNFNAVNFKFENGSHIALWLPSQKIQPITKADYQTKLDNGNYTAIAFLCDEQELSIKQPEAYVIRSFNVGKVEKSENDTDSVMVILNNPYTKPTSNPIIDFYLVNTNISKSGNKVLLTIDKNEFQLHNWSAYKVNGLSKGKHKIKIQLLDNKGVMLQSLFSADSTTIDVE